MTDLNQTALAAAWDAWTENLLRPGDVSGDVPLPAAIRAYLDALPAPAPSPDMGKAVEPSANTKAAYMGKAMPPKGPHPSHKTRMSLDASSYDEICVNCGATDISGAGWGRLASPCPTAPEQGGENGE